MNLTDSKNEGSQRKRLGARKSCLVGAKGVVRLPISTSDCRARRSRRWRAGDDHQSTMVIAATTLTPAAFWSADDLEVIRGSNRAAAGHGRGDFYSRPGRELGPLFCSSRRKIIDRYYVVSG